MRSIETNLDARTVRGVTFSPDGCWLYCAEISCTGWNDKQFSTSIGSADVQALFAEPVIEPGTINPGIGHSLNYRSVNPPTLSQFVTLPLNVLGSVIAVSPEGGILAVGTNTGDTLLIRVRGGETLGILKRKRGKRTEDLSVRRISFSPSGKQVAVVVDGLLRVADVKTTKSLWDAEDAKAHAINLGYHPDGKTLAVARSDGTAVFYDAQTGTLRKRYDWKVGQLNSIAFSPDGLTCAAGGEKGQVVVLDVEN